MFTRVTIDRGFARAEARRIKATTPPPPNPRKPSGMERCGIDRRRDQRSRKTSLGKTNFDETESMTLIWQV
jgi:hypothetical protein